MDAKKTLALAYAKPDVLAPRRTKLWAIPGWQFDALVVSMLLIIVALFVAT